MTTKPDDFDADERELLERMGDDLAALRERHEKDLPIEILRAAKAGALPEPLDADAARQLERSEWSRTLVDGADAADAELDDIASRKLWTRIHAATTPSHVPDANDRKRWLTALSAAAAILFALILIRGLRPSTPPSRETTTASTLPATPHQPAWRLILEKPPVRLTAAALQLRGVTNTSLANDIVPALDAYRADDYATAARELNALAATYPQSVEVLFYLGVSQLFLADNQAVATLDRAQQLNDDAFSADVAWYLAIAYERAGRTSDARSVMHRLCQAGESTAARACAAESALTTP